MQLPHSKVKRYFSEHMGKGKYDVHQMFDMYMVLMTEDEIITIYKPMKISSLHTVLTLWAHEEDGFLDAQLERREGRSYSFYTKRVGSLPKISHYLDRLKFSDSYEKVNRVLCGLLRKEHRDDSSRH